VEEHRRRGDLLGQSRLLGQDSASRGHQFVYGKPSFSATGRSKQSYGASELLRGKFSNGVTDADPDLGKSITPGFRNIQNAERSFGCPSIRSDIPKISISRRSIADSQNYGDDATAAELINPHAYANLAIDASALQQLKPKDSLISLFRKIGFNNIHDDIYDAIFYEASANSPNWNGEPLAAINIFRACLNAYLESIDTGREEQWLSDHGLM
jgi:hypothetical protein